MFYRQLLLDQAEALKRSQTQPKIVIFAATQTLIEKAICFEHAPVHHHRGHADAADPQTLRKNDAVGWGMDFLLIQVSAPSEPGFSGVGNTTVGPAAKPGILYIQLIPAKLIV
jgi:hypothetical protein